MQFIIVTGLSGAGKSNAIKYLEDMGYYCIDNMPPMLINSFITLEKQNKINVKKAAFVMDIRGGAFFDDLENVMKELDDEGIKYQILFLEATDDTLIRRFQETRRSHPLSENSTNSEAIKKERRLLTAIREKSDFIIDTSNLKPAELQHLLTTSLEQGGEEKFSVTVRSFGYKYGMPSDTDIVFDVRFIPNPYYIASMKDMTGNDSSVKDYVMQFEETLEFLNRIENLVEYLIPYYIKQGKRSLSIAFACTGGQHRSVAIANEFTDRFKKKGKTVTIVHRDVMKH